jgi:hypothetical protein
VLGVARRLGSLLSHQQHLRLHFECGAAGRSQTCLRGGRSALCTPNRADASPSATYPPRCTPPAFLYWSVYIHTYILTHTYTHTHTHTHTHRQLRICQGAILQPFHLYSGAYIHNETEHGESRRFSSRGHAAVAATVRHTRGSSLDTYRARSRQRPRRPGGGPARQRRWACANRAQRVTGDGGGGGGGGGGRASAATRRPTRC